jgi:hypothetical protein
MPPQQRESSNNNSRPAVDQQLLQRLVQKLLDSLVRRAPDLTILGAEDLTQLLCTPMQLSAAKRQTLVKVALLSAAYSHEGAESSCSNLSSCCRACGFACMLCFNNILLVALLGKPAAAVR